MSKKRFSWRRVFSLDRIVVGLILILVVVGTVFFVRDIKVYDYIVETNAFFAPFEYYDNREIVGVDVEIINRVAEKLDAEIEVKNVEFDMIIDNVASGVIADAGAAGLTITPARAEKVDFTIPYYTSVQYVVFNPNNAPEIKTREAVEGDYAAPANNNYVLWNALAGKTIGSQMGGTGYLFAEEEADEGVLAGTNTKVKGLESHQIAADAISSHIIDYAIADELAAKFIVEKNPELVALPLYYADSSGDYPAEESYAIAVNKQRPELLEAFNQVLAEMLEPGEDGQSEMDKLILKYMGLTNG
ncbi:MAG: ABC transporter substrate-binding protein [Candidatus Saccharibacteria bacterium]|nr:ABC transporter substrate-binding protein [Candidatus Saccharibacteria bacterium]